MLLFEVSGLRKKKENTWIPSSAQLLSAGRSATGPPAMEPVASACARCTVRVGWTRTRGRVESNSRAPFEERHRRQSNVGTMVVQAWFNALVGQPCVIPGV